MRQFGNFLGQPSCCHKKCFCPKNSSLTLNGPSWFAVFSEWFLQFAQQKYFPFRFSCKISFLFSSSQLFFSFQSSTCSCSRESCPSRDPFCFFFFVLIEISSVIFYFEAGIRGTHCFWFTYPKEYNSHISLEFFVPSRFCPIKS